MNGDARSLERLSYCNLGQGYEGYDHDGFAFSPELPNDFSALTGQRKVAQQRDSTKNSYKGYWNNFRRYCKFLFNLEIKDATDAAFSIDLACRFWDVLCKGHESIASIKREISCPEKQKIELDKLVKYAPTDKQIYYPRELVRQSCVKEFSHTNNLP